MTPFTFGISLTPRASAGDWTLVEGLLSLTLQSLLAQSDPDFAVVIAGHDRPAVLPSDPRIRFVPVHWPVEPPGPHNDDSGRKKHLINDGLLEQGGGLLMLVDADDWVDRRAVEVARRTLTDHHAGGLIGRGLAIDLRSGVGAPLPSADVSEIGFDGLCGSSTVAWLRPDDPDPLRRDPFSFLRSHHQWRTVAAEHGAALADLPLTGGYLINTGENHSDVHGPHAAWRRGFIAAVNAHGTPLTEGDAARFGLTLDKVEAVSALARGPARR